MNRFIIHTLTYHLPEVVEKCLQHHATLDQSHERYLVDVHYPMLDIQKNAVQIAILARDYGFTLLRPAQNRGVAGNWNWVFNELDLDEKDIICGLDPDTRWQKDGWDTAIRQVMQADPSIAYLCANRLQSQTTENEWSIPYHDEVIAGHIIRFYNGEMAWSAGAFSGRFMLLADGLSQEMKHYGYIEKRCMEKIKLVKMRWGRIMDFTEVHDFDSNHPTVNEWKAKQRDRIENSTLEEYLSRHESAIIL